MRADEEVVVKMVEEEMKGQVEVVEKVKEGVEEVKEVEEDVK